MSFVIKYRIWVWVAVLVFCFGCATQQIEDSESFGPTPTPSEEEPGAEAAGYIPPSLKIGLVLGGAGVASFATVGLLKQLEQEKIHVSFIVTTGWPTLFALGYGFFSSIHDLEWFAMRLEQKDFFRSGIFDFNKGYAPHDRLSELTKKLFEQQDLRQTKIPIIISTTNTHEIEPVIIDEGEWRAPLLQTMSVPGIYRPYTKRTHSEWIQSLSGLDVEEAIRRKADVIVAVQMYEDYFRFIRRKKDKSSEGLFRQLYLTQYRSKLNDELKKAQISSRIYIRRKPTDFSAKRRAIHAGKQQGIYLANQIREWVRKQGE